MLRNGADDVTDSQILRARVVIKCVKCFVKQFVMRPKTFASRCRCKFEAYISILNQKEKSIEKRHFWC